MARFPALRGKGIAFLLVLWFLWFLNFGMRTMFSPLLPLIEDEFLVSHARATSVLIFLGVGYAVSLFSSGLFAGRIGYKRAVVVSLYTSSVVFLAVPFVKDLSTLYFASFVIGLSMGVYFPSIIPLVTESFAEKDWSRAIAVQDCAAPIAIFATPFIALGLLHFVAWRWIFCIYAGFFIISATTFALLGQEVKILHPRKAAFGALMKSKSLWIVASLTVVALAVNLGVYFIIPLYLTKELSANITFANTVLGISRFGGIIVAIMAGLFINRIQLTKMLFFIFLISGILTMLVGFASLPFIGLFLFLQTTCVTAFFPVSLVIAAKVFSRETRGMAMGIIGTISTIVAVGIIPCLLGLSGDLISFRFGIIVLGAIAVLSSWLPLCLGSQK